MQIVKATLKANPNNSVIGFKDNSSAIRCHAVRRTRAPATVLWQHLVSCQVLGQRTFIYRGIESVGKRSAAER